MKIYFCDKCHESIPLKDIKTNRITIDAGKIYCQGCAPKPTRSSRSVNLLTFVIGMVVCLAGGMAVAALWGEGLLGRSEADDMPGRMAKMEENWGRRLDDMGDHLQTLRADLQEVPTAEGSSGKLARALQGIRNNANAMKELRDSFNAQRDDAKSRNDLRQRSDLQFRSEIDKRITQVEGVRGKLEGDLAAIHGKLDGIQGELRLLDDKVGNSQPGVAPKSTVGSSGSGATAEPTLDPKRQEKLDAALVMLKDPEAPKRFQAVFDVSEFRGVRAGEEALVGALDDEMDYVQTAALNNLAEMDVKWAIPNVIKKLTDKNAFVVEAAIDALGRLTGNPVELDPNTSSLKILSKVRELEKWWNDNKVRILAGK